MQTVKHTFSVLSDGMKFWHFSCIRTEMMDSTTNLFISRHVIFNVLHENSLVNMDCKYKHPLYCGNCGNGLKSNLQKKTELKCRLRKVWKVIKLTKSKVINQRNELYNNCHNIILIYCLYSAIISFLIYLLFSVLYKFNKTMTQSSTVCLLNFCILTGTYRICRS